MKKKSQVTMFIIVGVIILAVFGLLLILRSNFKPFGSSETQGNMQDYIERCVKYVGGYGLYKLGMQGGSIYMPSDYFSMLNLNVAYAYNNGKKLVTLPEMENQLSVYIEQNLDSCISDYILEEKLKEEITIGAPAVKTTIARNDVLFEVKLPLSVTKDLSQTKTDENYNVIMPIRLKLVYSIMEDIVNKKASAPEDWYLDCLYEPVDVVIAQNDGTSLVLLQDNESMLFNEPYKFVFAIE